MCVSTSEHVRRGRKTRGEKKVERIIKKGKNKEKQDVEREDDDKEDQSVSGCIEGVKTGGRGRRKR